MPANAQIRSATREVIAVLLMLWVFGIPDMSDS